MTIHQVKEYVFTILEHESESPLGKTFERILFITIVVSILSTILETLPRLFVYNHVFWWIEVVYVSIFIVEYLARIWTADFRKQYEGTRGLIRFIFTPLMILDLLSIIPFFLYIFLPIHLLQTGMLRFFRLIRIIRIIQIGKYTQAFSRIVGLINRHKEDLVAIFFFIIAIVSFLSTLMYFLEHSAQPQKFSSIPASIWWGITTVSTIGYGDIVPITDFGKIVGGITAVFGVAIFALPTAVLGASFYAEIHSSERKRILELEKEIKRLEKILEWHEIPTDEKNPNHKNMFSDWWPW